MGPCCGSCDIGCRAAPLGIMSVWGLWCPAKQLPTLSSPPVQLRAFVSTLHFPGDGPELLKMTNNFRPPQPLHSRKVFASRAATASGVSPCGGCHQHLSLLLLLALLSPFLPTP